jgi:hypothetical protein
MKPELNDPHYPLWQEIAEVTMRRPSLKTKEEILAECIFPQGHTCPQETLTTWAKEQIKRRQAGQEIAASAFHSDLLALCRKHGLCAVPTYGGKPSAHDPMHIVPLDNEWTDYLKRSVYRPDADDIDNEES